MRSKLRGRLSGPRIQFSLFRLINAINRGKYFFGPGFYHKQKLKGLQPKAPPDDCNVGEIRS
jgi:hypothetical protein